MEDSTTYSGPSKPPIVLALAGDSTITSFRLPRPLRRGAGTASASSDSGVVCVRSVGGIAGARVSGPSRACQPRGRATGALRPRWEMLVQLNSDPRWMGLRRLGTAQATGAASADAVGASLSILSVFRLEKAIEMIRTTSETPAIDRRAAVWCDRVMTAGRISSETRFITLINGLSAGPAVSLNGSPMVSPMTAALWASEPFPPSWPSSMYFLALSHAPPELDRKLAMS